MKRFHTPWATAILSVLLISVITIAQEPQSPDVIKVYTELVRTDVTVVDKEGRFVTGLKQSDFEIKIDGQPREIQSLDQVVAGTSKDLGAFTDRQTALPVTNRAALDDASERKRTVLFFVDDLHMDLPGLSLLRKTLNDFIEKDMNYNTEAAIVSASGSIGFLQQLTDNKDVLREAARRITLKPYKAEDRAQPRMREIDALLIDRGDREVLNYFVDATMRLTGQQRDSAINEVTERTRDILLISSDITKRTLASLEQLIVTAGKSPGRKLLILGSDGFILDHRNSDIAERAQEITGLAARNGVVIYSMDSRGLVPPMSDMGAPVDRSHRMDRANNSAVWYTQELMNLLAKDTGGKTIFNTNDLSAGLQKALRETSVYYMLTWKPNPDAPDRNKFRKISVSVIGRPDLSVQVRKGFYGGEPRTTATTKEKGKEKPIATPADPKAELRKTLLEPVPQHQIPVSLALNYLVTPDQKITLSASIQISRSAVSFAPDAGGNQSALLEVAGVIFDDKGRPGGQVDDLLTVKTTSESAGQSDSFVSTYPIKLGPGLYQVRVAVRDKRTGLVGNANAWANIPNLSGAQLSLSSLILGDGKAVNDKPRDRQNRDPFAQVNLNVDRRYLQDSNLRLMIFAYNARPSAATAQPDLAIQIEVLRNQEAVISAPFKPISTKGVSDLRQLPYAADVPLTGLARGHYEVKVTVVDRVAKLSASRVAQFEIE